MEALHLEIVTPDNIVLTEQVDYVGAPGVDGEFGILSGHIPLLSALKIGGLYYRKNGKTAWAFLSGGFAQVADNKVTILAESAEMADSIDLARAESAKKRAETYLTNPKADTDMQRAHIALERATFRINIARMK